MGSLFPTVYTEFSLVFRLFETFMPQLQIALSLTVIGKSHMDHSLDYRSVGLNLSSKYFLGLLYTIYMVSQSTLYNLTWRPSSRAMFLMNICLMWKVSRTESKYVNAWDFHFLLHILDGVPYFGGFCDIIYIFCTIYCLLYLRRIVWSCSLYCDILLPVYQASTSKSVDILHKWVSSVRCYRSSAERRALLLLFRIFGVSYIACGHCRNVSLQYSRLLFDVYNYYP